jgi:hypothetical protein
MHLLVESHSVRQIPVWLSALSYRCLDVLWRDLLFFLKSIAQYKMLMAFKVDNGLHLDSTEFLRVTIWC